MWAWVTSTASMLAAAKGSCWLSFSSRPCCRPQSTSRRVFPTSVSYTHLQAVATSIDALALGVSLSCIGANIWQAAAIIGGCTFLCCFVGVYLGHRFGCLLGRWAQVVGGWLLVGIGVKIFLEHTLGR